MSQPRVALLCGADPVSAAVANALRREFGEVAILVEGKEDRKRFLKRRLKRLGALAVAGQIAFQALVVPRLRRRSDKRISQILRDNRIDPDPRVFDAADRVASVNAPEATEWLARIDPQVVVVNGTRIIAKRVLEATGAVFLNTHCGITPEYRGAHGAYWALTQGDAAHCGVTVHLVDPGIDTGGILAQARIEPGPEDNFVTYPWLQIAAGLPLLLDQVRAALQGAHAPHGREAPSQLWYHPTIWGYFATGLRRGIW